MSHVWDFESFLILIAGFGPWLFFVDTLLEYSSPYVKLKCKVFPYNVNQ